MSLTLYGFFTSLQNVDASLKVRASYDQIYDHLLNSESKHALKTIIERCNQFMDTGIVANQADRTFTICDAIKLVLNEQGSKDLTNLFKVHIKHYGEWTAFNKNSRSVVSKFNVLFNRESSHFTKSDSCLIESLIYLAIKEYFFPENPDEFTTAQISRKLTTKENKGQLIDHELYEYKTQDDVLISVTNYIARFWAMQKTELCQDLNSDIQKFALKIHNEFLSILDQDMVGLLRYIQEPSNLINYTVLYSTFFKYKESLIKWKSDSVQRLVYALHYQHGQEITPDNPDYFSYTTLLGQDQYRTFLDKVSVRRVFQLDLPLLTQLLTCSVNNYSNYKAFFAIWTYWFGHTKHTQVNPNVFRVLSSINIHDFFQVDNPLHVKVLRDHAVALFDILYSYLADQYAEFIHFDTSHNFTRAYVFNESFDYYDADHLPKHLKVQRRKVNAVLNEIADFVLYTTHNSLENSNGLMTKESFYPNLQRISTRTTRNSLIRNAHIWHDQALQRQKGELIEWKQFKPFKTTIDGYTFCLLTDSHQVFEEAITMKHCLFSTFLEQICSGTYIAFSVHGNNERGTVGISIVTHHTGTEHLVMHQVKGESNSSLSHSALMATKNLVGQLNFNPELIYYSRSNIPNQPNYSHELSQEII